MVLLWLMLLACGLFAHGVFECRGLLEAAGNYDELAFCLVDAPGVVQQMFTSPSCLFQYMLLNGCV